LIENFGEIAETRPTVECVFRAIMCVAGFRKRIYPTENRRLILAAFIIFNPCPSVFVCGKKRLSCGNFSNVKISEASNRRLTFAFNRFAVCGGGAVFVEFAIERFAVES
jgi:hypothetical protein